MKCYTVDGSGIEHLALVERDEPAAPGPGEALVEVRAVSLNYRDLMVARGQYGGREKRPIVAASDMAGVVTAVGPGVSELRDGDRVVNSPFRFWPAGTMRSEWARTFVGGHGVDGVLAERVTYPAESLVPVPEGFSFVEASTWPIAALTAWSAVVTHGRARPGEWVLLHGTGGVSIFAAQIARLLGARTILSTSRPEKAQLVRECFGVAHTIDYRDESWPEEVRRLTGGKGVDVVVEVAGGESLARSIKACGYGARVGWIGVLGGFESTVSFVDLVYHQVTVRGIFMESTQELRAMVAAFGAHGVRPHVDQVFPFDRAREAYERLASREHVGKVVIQVQLQLASG
jgi:NADPH:quinone reductase-like Zn-dependent oxidoreductase